MTRLIMTAVSLLCGAIALTACDRSTSEPTSAHSAAVEAPIPTTLFAASAPENAVPLADAKSQAKLGDQVTFEARIGGRLEPFLKNRAVFFVADPSLQSCNLIPGDTCKTPWDYCCEPGDNLLKHMATVQVVDANGDPLKVSLQDKRGLAPLKKVVVTGTVDRIDESGNFVVNADAIFVNEG